MKFDGENHTPEYLEKVANITLNQAHDLAQGATDIISAMCAQALATVGLAQATLASSAWNVWIAENRHYDNKGE